VVPVFLAIDFSGAKYFVLHVSFHQIWKSHPAWSWFARRDFSFTRQSARLGFARAFAVAPCFSRPVLRVWLGLFFGRRSRLGSILQPPRFCFRPGFRLRLCAKIFVHVTRFGPDFIPQVRAVLQGFKSPFVFLLRSLLLDFDFLLSYARCCRVRRCPPEEAYLLLPVFVRSRHRFL
jgi:hypothetical protein